MTNELQKLDLPLPTAIVGLGLTGKSILRLLLLLGVRRDQIFLFDAKDSSADISDTTALLAKNPASLIVSPGVPLASPWIQEFRSRGGQITSELTLATSLLVGEKVVGVTGSIGKSTCASLLQAGLQEFSPHSFVGGNLGYPLADYLHRKLTSGVQAEWVVLELSSYQLENYANLHCAGSLITYLTPNHMERYPDLESYYASKWFLVERTSGPVVMNLLGGDLLTFAKPKSSALHWVEPSSPEMANIDFTKAGLVGDHNRENLALVIALARDLKWPPQSIEGFLKFKGLPHRLENLGVHDGALWINDSKATTIESVRQAVKSTDSLVRGTTHLLLGGKDKNLPWQDLASLTSDRRKFYFFGEVREKAQKLSGLPGPLHAHLKDAIADVKSHASENDLVLLSPGGTSLDEFKSFEDRGDFFRNQISKH